MAALQYKDDHNKIAYLGRERGSEDFTDILRYLDHSPLRFILEGMIGNVKATKNKFLMYPRFLQMIVAIETADRTPRPTFGFTRKLFANMRFKWEGQPMPLTPPVLAIAAAGDAADEENADAHEATGSTAEAHPEPHSPPVSPVRELTLERQPETEWVVPNPVSNVTDWRPWPSVPAHSPIRDTTPEPASPPTPLAQTFMVEEPLVFGPVPRPARDVDPDVIDSIIFGPQPRPHVTCSAEDALPHNTVLLEGARDPVLLTSLSEKLDRCMGRIDSLETELGTTKKIMGGAILTLVSRDDVDIDAYHVWHLHALGPIQTAVPSENVEDHEEDEASERLVQQLQAEALAQEYMPNVSEERAKELDELMMRMTETDWLNLMMQVGSNPALARELLGADVTEDNFIERMTAIKDKKKRALADLRYRALKGKPMKQSEVTQMMRNLVKNQWCAAHNGTITMTAVKAMTKQQLIEEYEYICSRLEKDRLLSAQYNLFRPKPAITEPPSKRQRVEHISSPTVFVPAVTTHTADDPDSAGGGGSNPAGSAFGTPVTDSTVPTPAAIDSAGISPYELEFSICHLLKKVSFRQIDEDAQIGMSRVAADPDSDDEVLAEILFRGKYISGAGVVVVDKLPDDEIVDPRVKDETVSDYASSPPRSRRKHRGVRSDDFLWDKPVEDFFSSESESDDDMEHYIPPLPYGEFQDWEMVSCPPGNSYIHVYYQQNRRRKYFTYLKQLLPHVYREDILLLRRRMNRVTPQAHPFHPIVGMLLCAGEYNSERSRMVFRGKHISVVASAQCSCNKEWLVQGGTALGKDFIKSVDGCQVKEFLKSVVMAMIVGQKCVRYSNSPLIHVLRNWTVVFTPDLELLFFDVAASFDSAVSFVAAVASTVSAACWFYAAAAYFVSAAPQSSCFAKIYLDT
ncbi:hypothetical protein Tco_1335440 [Tanacetum coccineum]